jgi:2,3-bisphosphoglycerate-dependent phosphoglycerate mutase
VKIWRRSYDIPPPPLTPTIRGIPQTIALRVARRRQSCRSPNRSRTRSRVFFRTGTMRSRPTSKPASECSSRRTATALRALVKYLDNVSEQDIVEVNIPTGIPLVYLLNEELKPLQKFYLGDQQAVQAKMTAVANQGKVRT